MLGRPKVLVCDEPTQGVDVGARVEIYRLLRELAADGCAIVVCSSDALELEGLCDRVMIMSRGQVVGALEADDVSEATITGTAVTSTLARKERAREERRRIGFFGRFLRGDGVATPVLAAVIVVLAIITAGQNGDFLTSFNIENLLLLSTALILVGLGQLIVLVTAGVDLSVGPMMGLGLVILTGFATDSGGTGGFFLGLGLAIAAGAGVGLINGGLVQFAKINAVIATLATFIGVQGIALLINPVPERPVQRQGDRNADRNRRRHPDRLHRRRPDRARRRVRPAPRRASGSACARSAPTKRRRTGWGSTSA